MEAQTPDTANRDVLDDLRFRRAERRHRCRRLEVGVSAERKWIFEWRAFALLAEKLLGPFVGSRVGTHPEGALGRSIQGVKKVVRSSVIFIEAGTDAGHEEEQERERGIHSRKRPAIPASRTAQERNEPRRQQHEWEN